MTEHPLAANLNAAYERARAARGATPELDRQSAIRAQLADPTETIGDFLDWLGGNGIRLAKIAERRPGVPELVDIADSYEQVMAAYFELDLKKIEQERRELLRQIRVQIGSRE